MMKVIRSSLIVLMFIVLFFTFCGYFFSKWDWNFQSNSQIRRNPQNHSHTHIKYILGWIKKPWGYLLKDYDLAKCPKPNCYFTTNRSLLPSVADFDAIIFDQRSFNMKNDAPSIRRQSQRYIYWTMESPVNAFNDQTSLMATEHFYNWSLTYRLDSTFPSPYGTLQKVKWHPFGKELNKMIQNFGENNKKLAKKEYSHISSGPAIAAWFVTNCNSRSGREDLVEQLQSVLKVDVYGGGTCSRMACKTPAACMDLLRSTYKFYLSVENSLCEDYVTEKFWKVLSYNTIPVLLNGANMTRHAPPNSYIDIKDFSSVKELGDYILRVSNDPALYASYFWWKDYYKLKMWQLEDDYCNICKALHSQERGEERIDDLVAWWKGLGYCKALPPVAKNLNFDKTFWAYKSRHIFTVR